MDRSISFMYIMQKNLSGKHITPLSPSVVCFYHSSSGNHDWGRLAPSTAAAAPIRRPGPLAAAAVRFLGGGGVNLPRGNVAAVRFEGGVIPPAVAPGYETKGL